MNNADNKSAPISIITATYNAAKHLPKLVESLVAQTDQDFEWVVADGGSTDETLAILKKAKQQLKNVVIDSRPDFGIYDALNRGVKLSTNDYYLVMGADDELFSNAVLEYKCLRSTTRADLISCAYFAEDKLRKVYWPRFEFLHSQFAYVSGHAVGLLIRKALHANTGYYSNKFPFAADQYFVLTAVTQGATVVNCAMPVGKFGTNGLSSKDAIGSVADIFRVNIAMKHNLLIQILIFFVRVLKIKLK